MAEEHTTSLTAAAIGQVLSDALPEYHTMSPCNRILEGSDHDVWCVGPNIILKGYPVKDRRGGTAEASLKRDADLARLLRRRMRRPNVIPEVFRTVMVGGWICNLERRILGSSLKSMRPTTETEDNLAEFLRDLIAVPLEEVRELGNFEEEERPSFRSRVASAEQASNELRTWDYVLDPEHRMEGFLEQELVLVQESSDTNVDKPVLLHADISGEHVIVDEADGRLKGLIDWSNARIGDAYRDIAGLSLAAGRTVAQRIGITAEYDRCTIRKGLLYAMCLTTQNLRDFVGGGDNPEDLLRTQFERSFEGTGLERLIFQG